jgi:hypothetical protein
MTKTTSLIFITLWTLTLPIVILAVGFAGNRLWSPSAVAAEIGSGQIEGLLIRMGLLLYALSPVIVYRSYRKRAR